MRLVDVLQTLRLDDVQLLREQPEVIRELSVAETFDELLVEFGSLLVGSFGSEGSDPLDGDAGSSEVEGELLLHRAVRRHECRRGRGSLAQRQVKGGLRASSWRKGKKEADGKLNERVGRSLEISSDEILVVESDSEGESFRVPRVLGVDLVSGSEKSNIIWGDEEVDAAVGQKRGKEEGRRSKGQLAHFLPSSSSSLSETRCRARLTKPCTNTPSCRYPYQRAPRSSR